MGQGPNGPLRPPTCDSGPLDTTGVDCDIRSAGRESCCPWIRAIPSPAASRQGESPVNRKQTDADKAGGRVSPTAPESQSVSAIVWRGMESTPGFNEELRQARADLEAGKGTPFREV